MAIGAGDYTWPERDSEPHPWPRPKEAVALLDERFASASSDALGSAADVADIDGAIVAQQPARDMDIREIRWLSRTLVIAYVRIPNAAYYYVVEKTDDRWNVVTYYLIWVS